MLFKLLNDIFFLEELIVIGFKLIFIIWLVLSFVVVIVSIFDLYLMLNIVVLGFIYLFNVLMYILVVLWVLVLKVIFGFNFIINLLFFFLYFF